MDQGLVKHLTSLPRSSECLNQCKLDNYELAMIVEGKNKTFNCTCIQRDFYKFTMQDFSSYCTDVSTRYLLKLNLQKKVVFREQIFFPENTLTIILARKASCILATIWCAARCAPSEWRVPRRSAERCTTAARVAKNILLYSSYWARELLLIKKLEFEKTIELW